MQVENLKRLVIKYQADLHGVGGSVVNALSKWMEVTIERDKGIYYIKFEDGGKSNSLKKIGTSNKTGTMVRFLPDDSIFSTINFSFTTICERMQESAFLKGLTIEVNDLEDDRHAAFHCEKRLRRVCRLFKWGKSTLHKL